MVAKANINKTKTHTIKKITHTIKKITHTPSGQKDII